MTKRIVEYVTETIEHSFEGVLGVPPHTTEIVKPKVRSELVSHEDYDTKDNEIETDLVDIQDKALELYEQMLEEIDDADQGKKARMAEVAGQLLNTALTVAKQRKDMKQHKDILKQKDKVISNKFSGSKTTNNVFVGSQEALVKFLNNAELKTIDEDDPSIIDV